MQTIRFGRMCMGNLRFLRRTGLDRRERGEVEEGCGMVG
jgi:hypothetical protein